MQAFALNERPSESRVPGDAGQLFLAGFPLGAGEEARGDVDEAGDQLEYGGGGPGTAVAGAILADVQSVRHAGERNILNNHLGQKLESLYFQGIVFQVTEVGRMVTFSRMRSIFFTEASLGAFSEMRRAQIPV